MSGSASSHDLTPAERELVRLAEEAGEPTAIRALRQASTDLGCCVTAFAKMENGTEQAPVHLRRQDAERAQARVNAALSLAARVGRPALTGCTPCTDCGIDYAALTGAWRVSDEFWQRVVGTDGSIALCPGCFIARADVAGRPDEEQPRITDAMVEAAWTVLNGEPVEPEWEEAFVKKASLRAALAAALGAVASPLPAICGVICAAGKLGEPLACAWEPGHDGSHSWATLPTFKGGVDG